MPAPNVDLESLGNGLDDGRLAGPVLANEEGDRQLKVQTPLSDRLYGGNCEWPFALVPRPDLDPVDDHGCTLQTG